MARSYRRGIPPDVMEFVNFQRLGFVATVNDDGTPNLSPKGTTRVIDKKTLVFADIDSAVTIHNLRHRPSTEINVVDIFSRRGYRFIGTAVVHDNGPTFERYLDYYKLQQITDAPKVIRAIVLVSVYGHLPLTSPAYALGKTEMQLIDHYRHHYIDRYP